MAVTAQKTAGTTASVQHFLLNVLPKLSYMLRRSKPALDYIELYYRALKR